jgi:hypothetical protein
VPFRIRYQVAGAGQRAALAFVSAERLATVQDDMEAALGPLALFAAMSDADKLQASATLKEQAMTAAASIDEQTDQQGLDPCMAYAPAVIGLGFTGGVSGLWTVRQPAGRAPLRIVDRPVPEHLIRSRLNRINWLQPSGAPEPVGIAFLAAAVGRPTRMRCYVVKPTSEAADAGVCLTDGPWTFSTIMHARKISWGAVMPQSHPGLHTPYPCWHWQEDPRAWLAAGSGGVAGRVGAGRMPRRWRGFREAPLRRGGGLRSRCKSGIGACPA